MIGRSTQLIMSRSFLPVTSIGCSAPCSRYFFRAGPPASSSAMSALVNSPDWISARIYFISCLTAALITRGPLT